MAVERNKVSLATAKVIPALLVAIIVYVSYIFTGPLVVDYLLDPPDGVPKRMSAGLGILIAYYLLLLPVGATWLRLLVVVWRTPGYVPLGPAREGVETEPATGLENFWLRDVFACDSRGLPIWCQHCNNWKPDRAHHNQDSGRCTLKMDHFCPWVGGVVGERSFKFFVQFNFYSFLFSVFVTSVLAYFVAGHGETSGQKVQWLVGVGLGGFFTLFTIGMVINSLWMACRNVTTIENIDAYSRTMLLAVLLPPELQEKALNGLPLPPQQVYSKYDRSPSESLDSKRRLTPDHNPPSHTSHFLRSHTRRPSHRSSALPFQQRVWKGTVTYPLHLPTDRPPLPAPQPRTFAILETLPGHNPWDIGSPFLNFKSVFGDNLLKWLLPLNHSPCCDHSSVVSMYSLGPDFEELLIEAGLMSRPSSMPIPEKSYYDVSRDDITRRRRRKPRLDVGWQNGERPDGWMSEKEARRKRNEARRAMQGGLPPGTGAEALR